MDYQYVYWDLEIVGELEGTDTEDYKSLEQSLIDAGIGSEPLYLLNRAKNLRLTILHPARALFVRPAGEVSRSGRAYGRRSRTLS